MTEEQTQGPEEALPSNRPDPFFKLLTRVAAEQHGLKADETELQYSTRADFMLAVPPGISLEGTMFDFFRRKNVVEFKSQGDPLTLRKYIRTEMRTDLQFLLDEDENFDNLLNVTVSSRVPRKFLAQARRDKVRFRRDKVRPWLWQAKVGFQDAAIVVCLDLPLEEAYYIWLAFAPSESQKWKDLITLLLRENNQELLDVVRRMRPKEFGMTLKEAMAKLEAEGVINRDNEAELDRIDKELSLVALKRLVKRKSSNLEELISELTPEERHELLKRLLAEQDKNEN